MAAKNELGIWGEQKAADYLESIGYCIIAKNWKAPLSRHELDIVAIGEGHIVFVEVKTRSSNRYGEPTDAVDWRKVINITKAANSYVRCNHINLPIRFDIIAIVGNDLNHIKHAFVPTARYY